MKIRQVLLGISILLIVAGVVLIAQTQTERKTVQVVPVPKTETIISFPYLVPGVSLIVLGVILGVIGVIKRRK